ncbi:hypothetical protein CVIRNUC_001315 [Coccomyxa viridis]|uniref:J domain-containing protein n=1 Tax=Coccomyxa viridis TaxID=1274662 RepID=A0AAV1HU38_9CHLO|nr:hypothetical protein CVIRNUC_001315 [Coccomyxa viridis]
MDSGMARRKDYNGMQQSNEAAEAQASFNDVFSLRKPKDAKAGLSSGLKSAAKGIVGGAVSLFAAPVVMAREEGVKGFAKGVGAGVLGAVALPVVGVGVGVAQIVRGVANTPEAIREQHKGKSWDQAGRRWVDQPQSALVLDDELFASAREQWHQSNGQASTSGTSGDYYGLLGVSKDASPEEIKRAYYVLARKLHPDKNRGDEQAHQRFQQLGEAYQVLASPELRKRYDAKGAEGVDVDFMDHAEFFNALFGSDRFEHLVGELMIAAASRHGDLNGEQMRRVQEIRQKQLVVMLNALLRRYVEGDVEGFREAMLAESDSLVKAAFGSTMLRAIGKTYSSQAEIFLGNFFEGSIAAIKSKSSSMKSQMHALGLAIQMYNKQKEIEALEKRQALSKSQTDEELGASADGSAAQHGQGAASAAAKAAANGGLYRGSTPASSSAAPVDPAAEAQDREQRRREQQQARAQAERELASERQKLEEAALPLMLDAMWAANVMDIQQTLKAVCHEVLRNRTVSKEVRRLRALALHELGGIFQDAAASHVEAAPVQDQPQAEQARQHFENAFQRIVDKRNAVDDASYGQS